MSFLTFLQFVVFICGLRVRVHECRLHPERTTSNASSVLLGAEQGNFSSQEAGHSFAHERPLLCAGPPAIPLRARPRGVLAEGKLVLIGLHPFVHTPKGRGTQDSSGIPAYPRRKDREQSLGHSIERGKE